MDPRYPPGSPVVIIKSPYSSVKNGTTAVVWKVVTVNYPYPCHLYKLQMQNDLPAWYQEHELKDLYAGRPTKDARYGIQPAPGN